MPELTFDAEGAEIENTYTRFHRAIESRDLGAPDSFA